MAKAAPQQLALQALSRMLTDPAAKPLHGSASKPGVFQGTAQPAKQAAQYCLDQGWLKGTGEFEGKGKTRKELYTITPAGIRAVLENGEAVTLLGDAVDFLRRHEGQLSDIARRVEETQRALRNHQELVTKVRDRLQPPDLEQLLGNLRATSAPAHGGAPPPSSDWGASALDYLADYQRRHPYGHCPLPELFTRVAAPLRLSIGQFHDGLRGLVGQGRIRLHAFTGAAYQLQDEQYALVAGQEIKYYAERVAST